MTCCGSGSEAHFLPGAVRDSRAEQARSRQLWHSLPQRRLLLGRLAQRCGQSQEALPTPELSLWVKALGEGVGGIQAAGCWG